MKFRIVRQIDRRDCGNACISMISQHYGKKLSLSALSKFSEVTQQGSTMSNLVKISEKLGFIVKAIELPISKINTLPQPCILHWEGNHFIVLYKIVQKKSKLWFYLADPAFGKIKLSYEEFMVKWIRKKNENNSGIALLLNPSEKFTNLKIDNDENISLAILKEYIVKYKQLFSQIALALVVSGLIQITFPFLTQYLVDYGIQPKSENIIYIILLAQLFFFLSKSLMGLIRGWVMLHLSTRINMSLLSDFFNKLFKIPIAYFDVKLTGDLLQRINDHQRIERILTNSSLEVVFSAITILVFSIVLLIYSKLIFAVFLLGTAFYFAWIFLFLGKRKQIDYDLFSSISNERSKILEILMGMQEIKLFNSQSLFKKKWENIQLKLFRKRIDSLSLEQIQSNVALFFFDIKDIFILTYGAILVIQGDITLGVLLSISFIIGQLAVPVKQFLAIIYAIQDAKIGMERLSEIYSIPDEDKNIGKEKRLELDSFSEIFVDTISFKYIGSEHKVMDKLSLKIPINKVTAIVGKSGSGKTTLMKILLKFYEPQKGNINLGTTSLKNINQEKWRDSCGVVMQDGYIFNMSVEENIALGDEFIDNERLVEATKLAEIYPFVNELPLGFQTQLGNEGIGISQGQKQRILIARAIYKNPQIIFLDEATSSLDTITEQKIVSNLNGFYKNRTVVVIAHRLSTVKNADQIVLLESGKIVEQGHHKELVKLKGKYYLLIQNQLELEQDEV